MAEIVATYADLAMTLPPPHGPDCPDIMCADIRKALGHRPLIPEFSRRARLRAIRPAKTLWLVARGGKS